MQEKFALRKTLKKVAAVGTSVAMLGFTLTGALAAGDLSQYPSGLGFGGADTVVVVGTAASGADDLAQSDVLNSLPTDTVSGASTAAELSSDSKSNDVALGRNIVGTNYFDSNLEDDDVNTLIDGKISFKGTEYDVNERIDLGEGGTNTGNVSVHTALTASDDDYEDGVYLELQRRAVHYYQVFEDSIQLNTTTSEDPLDMRVMGQRVRVTNIDAANKLTATVGKEQFFQEGDSVSFEGHNIKLLKVSSGNKVLVQVDDETDSISEGNTFKFKKSGVEIKNDAAFYTSDAASRGSNLVFGLEAAETYQDGDEFPGEDEDDPNWVWILSNLHTKSTTVVTNNITGIFTTGPTIGVRNDNNVDDSADGSPGVGECYDSPNNFFSICLDELSVNDDDYMELTVEIEDSTDLSDVFPNDLSSVSTLRIESNKKDSLKFLSTGFGGANGSINGIKTDTIWLWDTSNISVFYLDSDANVIRLAGNLTGTSAGAVSSFAEVDYGNTKNTNIRLTTEGTRHIANSFNLTLDILGDETVDIADTEDDVKIQLGHAVNATFAALGATADREESQDIGWLNGPRTDLFIGLKNEDLRTRYGIVIEAPENSLSNDRLVFHVPNDEVQAKVTVYGRVVERDDLASGRSTGTAAATMTDTELGSDWSSKNVVAIGGPCVNTVTASLRGVEAESCGEASGLMAGQAVLELQENGEHWALVAAGYDAEDTRRAALMLKAASDGSSTLPSKSSATVTGDSLSVAGITVA